MTPNPSRRGGVLRVLLIAVIVVVALGAIGLFFVDSAAAKAIETGGSYALGVPTRVKSTSIGLFSGKFAIDGLEVDNPQGFEVPRFLNLAHAGTEIGFSKLLGDRIEIDRVEIRGVEIDLERKDGKTNYDVILANLQKLSGEPKAEEKGGSSKEVVIKKLVLSDVKARIGLVPLTPTTTISLPDLELDDVGTSNQGATIAQVFERIVGELLASVVKNGGNLIPDDLGKGLKKGLEGLKGLGELGLEGLEGAGKALGEGAKGVGEGIKGLFGK